MEHASAKLREVGRCKNPTRIENIIRRYAPRPRHTAGGTGGRARTAGKVAPVEKVRVRRAGIERRAAIIMAMNSYAESK
jgi:hypothetical protein